MKGFVMNDPNVTPPGRGFWRWIKRRTDVLHCPVIVTASPQRTTGDAAKTTTKSRRVQGAKSKWGATEDSFHMWTYEYLVVFFLCKPISHNMKTTDRWTGSYRWSHYRTTSFESSGSWRSCQSYFGQLNTGAQQDKQQWGKHLSRTHRQPKNLLLASQRHQRHPYPYGIIGQICFGNTECSLHRFEQVVLMLWLIIIFQYYIICSFKLAPFVSVWHREGSYHTVAFWFESGLVFGRQSLHLCYLLQHLELFTTVRLCW